MDRIPHASRYTPVSGHSSTVKGARRVSTILEGVDLEVHGAQRRIREEGVVLAEHGQRVLRRAVCEVLERNRARLRVQPVWHGTGRWVAGGLVVGWWVRLALSCE